ncbi:hypothetical protein E2320_003048 [Naja naja]|nr:hypothetical protein E2320_003048 [Naja naja]
MDLGLHAVLGENQGSQVTECQLDMEPASEVLVIHNKVSPWEDIWVVLEPEASQAVGCRMDMAMAMELDLEAMDSLSLELSQVPYSSQLGGPAAAAAAASTKYGGAGQLPYRGQPQQPEATSLGDYGAGRYGDPSQLPYGAQPAGLGVEGKPGPFGGPQVGYESQPAQAIGLDGNGNGLGYLNSRDLQANGLGAAAYGPLAAGQAPGGYGSLLGPGQQLGGYRGKESKYGMNGYLGNGYRGRCSSGKC